MLNFFNSKNKDNEIIINQIKQELQGGPNMRNEEVPAPAPTVHEREINLTLLNDKLNYVISGLNAVMEKEGVELKD